VTGTYTILIQGLATGSATFSLYDATDLQGTITPGGPSVTVTTVPGQNETLTFTGSLGQQIGINLTNGNYSVCNLTLYDPNGLIATTCSCTGATNSTPAITLVKNGTYKILIDPLSTASGSVTVQATSVPPVTGTITPGGPQVPVSTALAGQDAVLTFSGTAGQRVSAQVTEVTNPTAFLNLVDPDSTNQVSNIALSPSYCVPCFMDTQTLATAGTYALWVKHYGTYFGSEKLQLYNVVDVTGTVTVGASAAPFPTNTPGQNVQLTFSGASAQQVTVHITSNSIGSMTVQLLDPNNNVLTSTTSSSGSFNLATQTLSATATYKITVDPSGPNMGNVSVNVTSP